MIIYVYRFVETIVFFQQPMPYTNFWDTGMWCWEKHLYIGDGLQDSKEIPFSDLKFPKEELE